MTIISVVNTIDGIAMSADGRLSTTIILEGKEVFYPTSDTFEKIKLVRNHSVGVAFFGEPAIVDGETTGDIIVDIDKKYIDTNDTVCTVAKKIQAYFFADNKKKWFRKRDNKVNFFVAGYDDKEQYVYSINKNNINRMNEGDIHSHYFGGDIALVKDILERFTFDPNSTPIGDAIKITEFVIDFVCNHHSLLHLRESCGGEVKTLKITQENTGSSE